MSKTNLSTGERILALISTLVLARHGKAPKTSPEQKDEERTLDRLGISQAQKLCAKINNVRFDTVVSSPLKRVTETIGIATMWDHLIITIPELTCPTDGIHPIDRMFNQLGYKPLSDYFAHELGDHLRLWGHTALGKVLDTLECRRDRPKQVVLVGGRAVLQNALGWAFCVALEATGTGIAVAIAKQMLINTQLGEAEAFRLTLGPGHVFTTIVEAEHIKLD